jgi:hypothetical protein
MHIQTYLVSYINICTYKHTWYLNARVHVHTYKHAYTCIYMHIHTYKHINTYHTHKHIYIYICTYTHTCMQYIHTYMQTNRWVAGIEGVLGRQKKISTKKNKGSLQTGGLPVLKEVDGLPSIIAFTLAVLLGETFFYKKQNAHSTVKTKAHSYSK